MRGLKQIVKGLLKGCLRLRKATSKEQQKNNKGTSKAHKQERKNEKNVRNYNNFERRKYDMDSLESKLMEVNMNGKINKAWRSMYGSV